MGWSLFGVSSFDSVLEVAGRSFAGFGVGWHGALVLVRVAGERATGAVCITRSFSIGLSLPVGVRLPVCGHSDTRLVSCVGAGIVSSLVVPSWEAQIWTVSEEVREPVCASRAVGRVGFAALCQYVRCYELS